jgi:hypothetical protein
MRKIKTYACLLIVIMMTMFTSSPALADPPDRMWVKLIKMSVRGAVTHTVNARLVIWDSDGDGTERAKVTAKWTLPDGSVKIVTGTTQSDGQVSIRVYSTLSGAYRMCVTDVSRRGYVYDPTRNLISCRSMVVP